MQLGLNTSRTRSGNIISHVFFLVIFLFVWVNVFTCSRGSFLLTWAEGWVS